MKNRVLVAVTALTLLAPGARAVTLDTHGTGPDTPPPPPPVVTCTLSQNDITVTSFADILGYQIKGSCTVSFPGTNLPPAPAAPYEGGGSWNSTNGMVNEYLKGRDAKNQEWEIHGGGTCKLDPWMTGPAGASCSGAIANATPNAPAIFLKNLKVPISAGVLDGQARAWLTSKTLAAIKLEHEPPSIVEPKDGATVTFPSNLVIAPYLDSPAKTYALEWQAVVNNAWTPETVMDQVGLKTPLPADKFGASQVWRVRARQHQSAKASWSAWNQFSVAAKLKPPLVLLGCGNTQPYGATYDVSAMPATLKAGTTTMVSIKVTNGSNQPWGAGSNFHLSYHWAQNGAVVVPDGQRTFLPSAVAPCQTVTLSATVKAPPSAGTFTIEWDMVEEGVAWFSTKGVPTGNRTVTATP